MRGNLQLNRSSLFPGAILSSFRSTILDMPLVLSILLELIMVHGFHPFKCTIGYISRY